MVRYVGADEYIEWQVLTAQKVGKHLVIVYVY